MKPRLVKRYMPGLKGTDLFNVIVNAGDGVA